MKPENKEMMVRGIVSCGFNRCGCITTNREDAERHGNVIASTPWHRHDEDPAIVEKELNALSRVYSTFQGYEGAMMGYEYKLYRK